MYNRFKNLKKKEKGQGLVEYALILVLVAIVVIAALMILGPIIGNVFSDINSSLSTVSSGGSTSSSGGACASWGECFANGQSTPDQGACGALSGGVYTYDSSTNMCYWD